MSYKVETTKQFDIKFKKLSKKYSSLKMEFISIVDQLKENPTLGNHLGQNVYKIRLSIKSKGKGKSGGARLISFVQIQNETITLLTIYNKGEKNSISDKEIKELMQFNERN